MIQFHDWGWWSFTIMAVLMLVMTISMMALGSANRAFIDFLRRNAEADYQRITGMRTGWLGRFKADVALLIQARSDALDHLPGVRQTRIRLLRARRMTTLTPLILMMWVMIMIVWFFPR
jgi:type II secretory pathway component PulK